MLLSSATVGKWQVLEPKDNDIFELEPKEDLHLILIQKSGIKSSLNIKLTAPEIKCELRVLQEARDKERNSCALKISHLAPQCSSNTIMRGLAHDNSLVEFTGAIHIQDQAHGSEAFLESKNLLVDKKAKVRSQPILEIYNDEVSCKHGATIGFLDEDALFYLRARGVALSEAITMLIEAFVAPIKDLLRAHV